uniref:Uncharacterized protein n=1 Tax=Romanomermis culicivorax TaxID=13658 RepID=A0A915L4V5_ROMCU
MEATEDNRNKTKRFRMYRPGNFSGAPHRNKKYMKFNIHNQNYKNVNSRSSNKKPKVTDCLNVRMFGNRFAFNSAMAGPKPGCER